MRNGHLYDPNTWPIYQYFNQNHPKYYRLCIHVRVGTLVFTPIGILLCLGCIAFGILCLLFPDSYTYIRNPYVVEEYSSRQERFQLFWQISILSLLVGNGLHIGCLITTLIGVKLVRCRYLIPELVFLAFLLGLVIFLSIGTSCLMALTLGFWLEVIIIECVLAVLCGAYVYVLIWCFRYLRDKRKALEAALASSAATKAVRFRSGNGKGKK